jgi:hypothetical protein
LKLVSRTRLAELVGHSPYLSNRWVERAISGETSPLPLEAIHRDGENRVLIDAQHETVRRTMRRARMNLARKQAERSLRPHRSPSLTRHFEQVSSAPSKHQNASPHAVHARAAAMIPHAWQAMTSLGRGESWPTITRRRAAWPLGQDDGIAVRGSLIASRAFYRIERSLKSTSTLSA